MVTADGSYLPKVIGVFYAHFDPVVGAEILCQVPEGAIATALSAFPSRPPPPPPPPPTTTAAGTTTTTPTTEEGGSEPVVIIEAAGMVRQTSNADEGAGTTRFLANFSDILQFVIPQPSLCGHLMTKATRSAKICGLAVRIEDQVKYNRNAFIFNLCFVFEREAELSGFEPIVRKTARILRSMEESTSLLSAPPPTFRIADLLEQLYLDLSAYSETSISLDHAVLDLALFPWKPNPPEIKNWDVPIAVAKLQEIKNGSWDMTVFKVCSFIDGINSVKRISELAQVDTSLARSSIQHLLYYGAVILVDLFQYSNCYTAQAGITDTAQYSDEEDEGVMDLRDECEAYVCSASAEIDPVPFATLLALYAKLKSGLTVAQWMDANSIDSLPIDVRRMIQFGVIKGFLRRVFVYPLWLDHPDLSPSPAPPLSGPLDYPVEYRRTGLGGLSSSFNESSLRPDRKFPLPQQQQQPSSSSLSSILSSNPTSNSNPSYLLLPTTTTTTTSKKSKSISIDPSSQSLGLGLEGTRSGAEGGTEGEGGERGVKPLYPPSLPLMLNGEHHTDEICLKYGISAKHLYSVLEAIGGVVGTGGGGGGGGGAEVEGEEGRRSFGTVCMLYV